MIKKIINIYCILMTACNIFLRERERERYFKSSITFYLSNERTCNKTDINKQKKLIINKNGINGIKESKSIYGNSSSRHNWMFETKEAINNVRENKIKKYYMI